MTTDHLPVPVTPLQLKLKQFSVWIETKFECRASRTVFSLSMAIAFAIFYAILHAQKTWMVSAPWPLWLLSWLLFGWAAFWVILQTVRRFHDLGRTGGLFWAVAVPFWVSVRVANLFHVADKPGREWAWVLLAAFCGWSIWLTLQLFFKAGDAGLNGYEAREPKN